jgi:hypothetical protein
MDGATVETILERGKESSNESSSGTINVTGKAI